MMQRASRDRDIRNDLLQQQFSDVALYVCVCHMCTLQAEFAVALAHLANVRLCRMTSDCCTQPVAEHSYLPVYISSAALPLGALHFHPRHLVLVYAFATQDVAIGLGRRLCQAVGNAG